MIGVGCFFNFFVCLLGALIAGVGSAFGEVTHLGFIEKFDAEFFGPFSAGSGLSGLIGTLLYLMLQTFGVPNWLVFFCLCVLPFIYFFNFFMLFREGYRYNFFKDERSASQQNEGEESRRESGEETPMLEPKGFSNDVNSTPNQVHARRVSEKDQTPREGFLKDVPNFVQIGILYFLEYSVITGYVDRISQLKEEQQDDVTYFEEHFFTICQFLYQVGVLVARSSLFCFRTKRTVLIAGAQGVVFFLFLAICLWWVSISVWICFALTLLCGVLGGWGYLFSVFRLLDNNKISSKNKEYLANWLMITADVGALLATGFVFVMDNTFLRV